MKNVGRVRPEIGTKKVTNLGSGQLREIVGEFLLGISPREIGVRLREPELRQVIHDVGTREGFRQKNQVRMFLLQIADHPFPKIEWFRMGIIDPENMHALIDPELDNTFKFLPKRPPVWRLEFKRIDILIFFWRILGILHGPIGTPSKPLRMLPDIGMIGRALVSKIECNLYAVLLRFTDKVAKVFQPAKVGMNGLMAAFFGTYRPWTAGIAVAAFACIVFALTMRMTDRVNGGKVEDIETQVRNFGQDALAVAKGSAGSWKHFVR